MPHKDPEKAREYDKQYREKNKERISEKKREYYEENKQRMNEKRNEYKKKLKEENPEKFYKQKRIDNWKKRGLICEDYDSLYCHYLNATHCENCEIEFGDNSQLADGKCMDHDHETGLFRNFLCRSCNTKRG